MNIGQTIKQARLKKKMSQSELSRKTGIAQTEISRIESGKRNISMKILNKILSVLNLKITLNFNLKEKTK